MDLTFFYKSIVKLKQKKRVPFYCKCLSKEIIWRYDFTFLLEMGVAEIVKPLN